MNRDDESVWTYVRAIEDGGAYTPSSYVLHKRDLSDLQEPYLSAVKRALADHAASQGRNSE